MTALATIKKIIPKTTDREIIPTTIDAIIDNQKNAGQLGAVLSHSLLGR
jgi:hypothetical protein